MQKDKHTQHPHPSGQSMVEYTLIVALVVFAFAVAIAATGPAIGNVFSNTVYNLLGTDPDEIDDLPDKDAFWLTVTWVSQQTPVEEPLPTRTRIPDTEVPTDGPSPTASHTPSYTPTIPTKTPTPTATPRDFEFIAPWHDSAEEEDHWRLGAEASLGTDPGWYAKFYADTELSAYYAGQFTSEIDPDKKYDLNFDWGYNSPIDGWPSGSVGDDFSISFRRHIYISEDDVELTLNMKGIDDGYRVWLLDNHVNLEASDPDDCSSTGITWGGNPDSSGDPTVYGDGSDYSDCLIIDAWGDHYQDNASAVITVDKGLYTVVVDFVEFSGGAYLDFELETNQITSNEDDAAIDSSGTEKSGVDPECRWANIEDTVDSNSADFRWDSWERDLNTPAGNRCHLELRGSVEIPSDMTDPILTFWDVWDLRDPSMNAYLEIADYDPDNDGIFERGDLVWTTVPIHTGGTTNYNWTYQHLNLREILDDPGTPELDPVIDNKYTLRFVLELPEGSDSYAVGDNNGYRLWWIDSISIDHSTQSEYFYTAQKWDLNDTSQADDFITSGRWELTAARTRGSEGFAWDDSPFEQYQKTELDGCGTCAATNNTTTGTELDGYVEPTGDTNDSNLRMHTLEFNGIVDLLHPLGVTDLESDGGEAIISFWSAYDLGDDTGLEVQYTTDLDYDAGEAPDWDPIPGGILVNRENGSSTRQDSLTFYEVNLEQLLTLEPSANGKFRIRFALIAGDDAGNNNEPGWWIDDIQLERQAISSFLVYPYYEGFEQEGSIGDWLLGGRWGLASNRSYRSDEEGEHSLSDSPQTNDDGGNPQDVDFLRNSDTTAEIRLAFDVNNDSPLNPYSPACTLPPDICAEPDNDLPNDPIMTFHWWHDLADNDGEHLYLEWKKADDTGTWETLWVYRDRMSWNSSTNNDTRVQRNWQRVEVDLRQIWAESKFDNNVPDSATDDDILFRFRLETDNDSTTADGVYIDEIKIEERVEKVHALWDEGSSEEVDNNVFPTTGPLVYTTSTFRYVRFVEISPILKDSSKRYATIAEFNLYDPDSNVIDRSSWSIIDFSDDRSNDPIGDMLDGDTGTQWFADERQLPHWFELDLGTGEQPAFFSILPRQLDPSNSWYRNGWIHEYQVYVSNDPGTNKDWQLVADGELEETAAEQTRELRIDYTTDTPPAGQEDTVTIVGNGVSYRDNLDDRADELFDNWYLGGTWEVVEWAQYDGVLAFHDSTSVPIGSAEDPETLPPDFTNYTTNTPDTFNVLEMVTIMDLRATPASSRPIMTFWQRHQTDNRTDLRVQVAYEDPSLINSSDHCWDILYDQCYDHYYGWSDWQTIPPWNLGGAYDKWDRTHDSDQFLWKREIFDLSSFAQDGDEDGKRIRIRFISDSMDQSTAGQTQDGWFIDNIEFKFYNPPVLTIDADTGQQFFDGARNTRNWLLEGTWGLSPEFFRGSGGGPADFGGAIWDYYLFDFRSCPNWNNGFRNCVRDEFNTLDNATDMVNSPYYIGGPPGKALDISYDWGSGGPKGLSYKFGGIWEITTPQIGTTMNAGNYTFVLTYDDALRMKFDTVPAGGLADRTTVDYDPYDPEWNIYNDFNKGGRQVNVGNALFETGDQYKIRMEYYDHQNDATLILSLGSSSFSFTDSPKQAAGAIFPEVPAAPQAESSMMFNAVLDLSEAVLPIIRYYTYYELGNQSYARFEVTRDGGFTWEQREEMETAEPPGFWQTEWQSKWWNDRPRRDAGDDGRMAYASSAQSSTGNPDFDESIFPPDYTFTNGEYVPNENWGSGRPIPGWVNDDFSVQFRRTFTVTEETEMKFKVVSDDGSRLWINLNQSGYFPQCYFLDGIYPLVSGQPRVPGENDEQVTDNNSCMIISDWENSGNNSNTVTRMIPPGTHEIIIDHYERGGGAKLFFDLWVGGYENPQINNSTYMPDDGDWQERVHALAYYAGRESDGDPKPPIGIRFQLDRINEGTNGYEQRTNQSPTNWMESWWITDITIVDTIAG